MSARTRALQALRRSPALLTLLLLSTCSSPRAQAVETAVEIDYPDLPAHVRETAAAVLEGFDPSETDSSWLPGDSILYGVSLATPGESRHWLILLECQSSGPAENAEADVRMTQNTQGRLSDGRVFNMESELFPVRVSVFDARGRLRGASVSLAPEASLKRGLFSTCELVDELDIDPEEEPPPDLSLNDYRKCLEGALSVVHLFRIVAENEELAPILWEVVRRPPLLKMLFSRSISLKLSPDFQQAMAGTIEWEGPLGDRACYRLPMEISLNDRSALVGHLTVVAPSQPLQLGAGIVSVRASKPGDASRRMHLQLLAARRGPKPTSARAPARDASYFAGALTSESSSDPAR